MRAIVLGSLGCAALTVALAVGVLAVRFPIWASGIGAAGAVLNLGTPLARRALHQHTSPDPALPPTKAPPPT